MSPINGFIVISLIATAFYLFGVISFLTDYETGKCEMTYMFEYPQFVRITNEADLLHNRYGLYAYSEGRLTERARNMDFDGIPVLFIPGSAGSHKQVRSLSSIALRKALNSKSKFHFDYFTLDLNNELSALNGALLEEQLKYVNSSIGTVLNLYNKGNSIKRNSLILIGHSMGGVIAKALLSTLPSNSDLVPIVITLSAPLKYPVIILDHFMEKFYRKHIVGFRPVPAKTTIISIAGGFNDFLVQPHLTEGGHLNLVATNVPRCWVSTDHLSILWCKQLILAINRALFDCVDPYSRRLIEDGRKRLQVFGHHLVRNSGIRVAENYRYEGFTQIDAQGEWKESEHGQYSVFYPTGTRAVQWLMAPIKLYPNFEQLTVMALNMEPRDWAFVCPAMVNSNNQKYCDIGKHLTQVTEIVPSLKYKWRMLHVNMHQLKLNYSSASHVVTRLLPTNEFVSLHFDISNPRERVITVDNPPAWYSWSPQLIINETQIKALYYDLVLPHFTQVIQSYTVHLDSKCATQGHHTVISLKVPWSHNDDHKILTDAIKPALTFRLYKSKPLNANGHATIRLTLDPKCRYKVSLKSSYDLGAFARFYSLQLIANIVAVVLMILSTQLKHIGDTDRCSIAFAALKEGAKPYYVIPVIKVTTKLFDNDFVAKFLPRPDHRMLVDENMDFLLMPVVLYLVSVGIVFVLSLVLSVSFVFFESTLHKFGMKIFAKAFTGRMLWTDHILKAFEKIPGIVSGVLIAMSYSTCGGLAICLATIFYFIKLTQMAQDFIEDLVKNAVKSVAFKISDKLWPKIKIWFKKRPCVKNKIEEKSLTDGEPKKALEESEKEHNEDEDEKHEEQEIQDIVPLEKPMEIEILPTENSETIEKMDGDKLIELLNNTQNAENSNETESTDSLFNNLPFDWLQELMENNEIFFHFTIFLLYLIVAALNVPSVLTWARNYRFSKSLNPDPAYVPALILSCCTVPLWQLSFPKVEKKYFKQMSYLIYAMAIVSLTYGLISIYRLSFMISGVVTAIVLHQLLAPNKPNIENLQNTRNDDDSFGNKVKSKWE